MENNYLLRKPLHLFLLTILYFVSSQQVFCDPVTSKGYGDTRKIALSDALRNAISQEAGIEIKSMTSVKNFELEMDRIFSGTSGIVTNYRILSEDVSESGVYEVTVQANVDTVAAEKTFKQFKESTKTQQIFQREMLENRRIAVVYNQARKDNLPENSKGVQTLMDRIRDELLGVGFRVYLQDDLLRIYTTEAVTQNSMIVNQKALREAAREAGAEILVEVRLDTGVRTMSDGHVQVFADMDLRMVDVTTGSMFASVRQQGKTLTYQGKYQVDEGIAAIAVKYGKVASDRMIQKIVERLSGSQQKAVTLIFKNLNDDTHDSVIDVFDNLGWNYQIPKETDSELEIEVLALDRTTVRTVLHRTFKQQNMKFKRRMQGQRITYILRDH